MIYSIMSLKRWTTEIVGKKDLPEMNPRVMETDRVGNHPDEHIQSSINIQVPRIAGCSNFCPFCLLRFPNF